MFHGTRVVQAKAKCDTQRQTTDKVIPMWSFASLAPQKWSYFHTIHIFHTHVWMTFKTLSHVSITQLLTISIVISNWYLKA